MPKKFRKLLVPAMVILGMMAMTVAASAEENGYCTENIDSEGNTVSVFIYTEPVDWTVDESAGLGRCLMVGEEPVSKETTPISGAEHAGVHYADAQDGLHAAAADPVIPAGSDLPLVAFAAVGMLLLGVLGFALYKAV